MKIMSLITAAGVASFCLAASAQAEKLRDMARCSGIVLAQSLLDRAASNENDFEEGARLAFLAYFVEANSADYDQTEIAAARGVMEDRLNDFVGAVSDGGYTPEMTDKLVGCLRYMATTAQTKLVNASAAEDTLSEAVDDLLADLKERYGAAQ